MRRPAIPDVPHTFLPAQREFLQRVKENIETTSGRRGGRIAELSSSATTAQIISKINEIISAMQG